jgi:hypothetical protein
MSADISFFTDPPADPEPPEPKGKPRKVEITDPLSGLPKAPKYRVITEKHLKMVAKEMALGMKALDRMNRPPPMTEQERKERRALAARERRAAEAVKRAILYG